MSGGLRSEGLVGQVDQTEVLDAADLASRREAEHQAISWIEHQARAAWCRSLAAPRGVCLFFDRRLPPRAVYCDPECRTGHEAEQRARERQGRAGG